MTELSRTFKVITAWLVVGVAVFLGVQWWQAQQQRARFSADGGVIELRRSPDGHFHWPGHVNGVAVEFLVDTGATSTALPQALAERAGLVVQGSITSSTAGGTVRGGLARADVVLQGGVTATQLRVAVLPALEAPLLGMDILSRMHFSQRGGVLRLEPAPH
ncbi:TIGR02281 family clan AA aspartic protease [Aquincola sp. MAHUQ-54]|uniref:TIGR02281 family clan AA aspartic protease n=1 Tax=Aquincola agrisoli TaxID=3119538 RepID=A0AAW9QNW9_9BURK